MLAGLKRALCLTCETLLPASTANTVWSCERWDSSTVVLPEPVSAECRTGPEAAACRIIADKTFLPTDPAPCQSSGSLAIESTSWSKGAFIFEHSCQFGCGVQTEARAARHRISDETPFRAWGPRVR